jgi:hypothetical protein
MFDLYRQGSQPGGTEGQASTKLIGGSQNAHKGHALKNTK